MKLLILTCNTGMGHNSCAAAIQEEWEARGNTCDIVDSLAFISVRASDFISAWHTRIYRYAPKAFSVGYAFAENHPELIDEGMKFNLLFNKATSALETLLEQGQYDAMLCVHVFPAMFAAKLREQGKAMLPTGFLATDYTCSPSVEEGDADFVFIPHEALRAEFISRGIPAERIVVSGIPVHKAFAPCTDKRAARERLGLPPEGRNLLMMGGSMGCGPIKDIAKLLSDRMKKDETLTVVCGSNERLYASLEKDKPNNLLLYGYTKEIPMLMDAADALLTKPGGISISEAAAKRLPMVLLCTVDGCEERNLAFFLAHGLACSGQDAEEVTARCLSLLLDDEALDAAALALTALDGQGAQRICDTLMGLSAK